MNRGNSNSGEYVFELAGGVNVTLDHLAITGAYDGIYGGSSAGSTGLTVCHCAI